MKASITRVLDLIADLSPDDQARLRRSLNRHPGPKARINRADERWVAIEEFMVENELHIVRRGDLLRAYEFIKREAPHLLRSSRHPRSANISPDGFRRGLRRLRRR
jgi:hypothetical protein